MSSVTLKTMRQQFHRFTARRVQQGQVAAGKTAMGTVLGSCVCVGFFHGAKRIGAISHITGFDCADAHSPAGALDALAAALENEGAAVAECACFVLGGSDKQRHVYHATAEELARRDIPFTELDVLGQWHRKLVFEPATGEVWLYKGETLHTASEGPEARARFQDPKRRISTGATVFFRNQPFLDFLCREGFPALLPEAGRFHIWCAGCSIGMEVYSLGMVALDWLRQHRREADFRILGTDISDEALQTARAGVYPMAMQHGTPYAGLLDRYTEALPNRQVRIGPVLRRAAVFKLRDIELGSRRHRFEVVVCDHVLQYFTEAQQYPLLQALSRALAPGGYLYVSTPSTDVARAIPKRFALESRGRHIYQKPAG